MLLKKKIFRNFFQREKNGKKIIFLVWFCVAISTSLPNNLYKKLDSVFPGVKNPKNGLDFT